MGLSNARERAMELCRTIDDGIDPRREQPTRRPTDAPFPGSAAVAATDSKHSIELLVTEFIERHLRPTRIRLGYAEGILAKHVLPEWRGCDARTGEAAGGDRIPRWHSQERARDGESGASLLGQMFKFGIRRAIVATSPVQLLHRPGGRERPGRVCGAQTSCAPSYATGCCRYPRVAHVMKMSPMVASHLV
jgi:hypothetical protein